MAALAAEYRAGRLRTLAAVGADVTLYPVAAEPHAQDFFLDSAELAMGVQVLQYRKEHGGNGC